MYSSHAAFSDDYLGGVYLSIKNKTNDGWVGDREDCIKIVTFNQHFSVELIMFRLELSQLFSLHWSLSNPI